MKRLIALLALLSTPLSALAADRLGQQVSAILSEAGPGTRWGVVVSDDDGKEIISIDPEGRYVPASNTKLFTTAAAFWKFSALELDEPDQAGRASAYLIKPAKGLPDVLLIGRGDARLSSAADCKVDCLATLADSIAKQTRKVRNVLGDDSAFEDQRWSPGMSWNNIPSNDGTGVSALTLDDNEVLLTITPAKQVGAKPLVSVSPYFTVINDADTFDDPARPLGFIRLPGSRVIRLGGSIATSAAPRKLQLGIDDPADYAAWTFARMLRARGVTVSGTAGHRFWPQAQSAASAAAEAAAIASAMVADDKSAQVAPPLIEDLSIINKVSQNLHAELLLRRLGPESGPGSIEGGQKVVTAMLAAAGVKPGQYAFSDGSGMSTYNRVAPRGTVTFLRWTQGQPWGARFKATLPIGGVDGTLRNRYKGTSLEGRIVAKTGTLNATNALAGFLTTKSGKLLTFAAYANDVPDGVKATSIMDKALVLIAEVN